MTKRERHAGIEAAERLLAWIAADDRHEETERITSMSEEELERELDRLGGDWRAGRKRFMASIGITDDA